MNTLKAILLMSIWTSILGAALYFFDAHAHYRNILWATVIGLTLLITHMVNMFIYFKVAGDKPVSYTHLRAHET